ncbi:NAD-dependent epimerase/dehydratase family protein [Lutibaculum baratangense]|uniref:UDP-glucose 4-epimerase n=1 Tax=Lutibaculum baratangense AMV1 TaxID=631454 RepID=V4RGM3_9HYPH|nr:NAD-dependent epimerase/dehydratase family protein [Lutibaculum baratangense]ESR25306.1 UDP-glucose 4-epimerase [Lutibaculum baratangense AMV1]
MSRRILITGGAGFIGRHVAETMLRRGHEVRILDNFHEQVHGPEPEPAPVLRECEVLDADIRDPDAVGRAIEGVDWVAHLAAEVGVGQSMYEIDRYTGVNEYGTAVLFQKLIEQPVERVVTASSMSIYGEGLYRAPDGTLVEDARRRAGDINGQWDPVDDEGRPLEPAPTPETKRPSLSSVYALNKYAQEQMTLISAPAYGMEAVCLRLFNVFGPGQALSNPYTGVLAIFASRVLNGQAPMVFEDGNQRRDFVHVTDVAEAFALAFEVGEASGETINVGSGQDISIAEVGNRLLRTMGRDDLAPEITGKFRAGDIRHCFADISKAREVLGFAPLRGFDEALSELTEWLAQQKADDRVAEARRELEARGLVS